MSNGQLERLIYAKGQLLTSKDFEDQQEYHRKKLDLLIQRFSHGIVRGLTVECDPPKESPDDFEAFKITGGLAVDEAGNAIVVGSEGLRIPVDEYYQNRKEGKKHLFLSLSYEEKKRFVVTSLQDSSTKNNRITESIEHEWDEVKNKTSSRNNIVVSHITLARIREVNPNENIENKKTCDNGLLIIEEESESEKFRLNAGFVEEEQLSDDIRNQLVKDGDQHHHAAAHEARIPEDGLDAGVKGKLVSDGNTHNHTGGAGARIPVTGLTNEVTVQLVTRGNAHDHTPGQGALIREAGLDPTVQGKLVIGGDAHNHTPGRGGTPILEAGLDVTVQNRLVTGGDAHNHTPGQGALIREAGLDPTVQGKLVTGGDAHNHTSAGAGKIPLAGLDTDVTDQFVTMADVTLDSNEKTIPPGVTEITATIEQVEKHAIIHIIPTRGSLSWTFTVAPDGNLLQYTILVVKAGNVDEVVEFDVKKIVFGTG